MSGKKSLQLAAALSIALSCMNIGAQQSAPAAEATTLRPVKTGDKLTYQRTAYEQPTMSGKIALSGTPGEPFVVTVLSSDEHGRSLKFADGVELRDERFALIGVISNEGVKHMFDPKDVMHWMPEGELKPGMKWKLYKEYKSMASDYPSQCVTAERYDAVSRATSRDVMIDKKLVHVDAIEISMKGRYLSVSSCTLSLGEMDVLRTIVYSKDLNLVLEDTSLTNDDYGNMVGKRNRREVITAIN